LWVKICGVTRVADALAIADVGADAIGLNFVPGSPRRIDIELARRIAGEVRERVELVAVVADPSLAEARALHDELGLAYLQLHGSEPATLVAELQPFAYKAVRVGSSEDAALAQTFPGDRVLVDAKVEGVLGGTGRCVDPLLIVELARRRRVILAGGLTPENVADALRVVRPFGVDVASGVEELGLPGVKSRVRVAAFVAAAKGAAV